MAPSFGNLSPNEKLSEIKPPLVKMAIVVALVEPILNVTKIFITKYIGSCGMKACIFRSLLLK